jgi:hypothetical protein
MREITEDENDSTYMLAPSPSAPTLTDKRKIAAANEVSHSLFSNSTFLLICKHDYRAEIATIPALAIITAPIKNEITTAIITIQRKVSIQMQVLPKYSTVIW